MTSNRPTQVTSFPQKRVLASAISAVIAGTGAGGVYAQGIEEIVVTARKRTENLQDIPQSIQAITSDQLRAAGLNSTEDYARFIPSLSYLSSSPGATKIVFRGVADAASTFIADSSAAIYLDEQPITTVGQAPDLRMIDIERVEALSGPQGTLYGSSSQSGTLRIITNKPDATEFSGTVEAEVNTVDDGGEGYDVSAVVNLPIIEDTLAVRFVGYHVHEAGFIDNVLGNTPSTPPPGLAPKPTMGQTTNANQVDNNINDIDWFGGRISARWLVNDKWTATASGLYQKVEADGRKTYDPTVGDLEVIRFFDEPREDEWYQMGLTIEGDLGFADLTIAGSYFDRDINYTFDRTTYTNYFHWSLGFYYGFQGYNFGDDPIGFNTLTQNDEKKSIEVRLSHEGTHWDWIAGFFYEDVEQQWNYRAFIPGYANSPALAYWNYLSYIGYLQCPDVPCPVPLTDPQNAWWHSGTDDSRDQIAFFTEHTFRFTDKLSVIAGMRWYDASRDIFYFVERPQFRRDRPANTPTGGSDGVLPKVGFQYNIDDDKMIYALYSEGFRAGGTNRSRASQPTFPEQYDEDKLINYEAGFKTTWLDGSLRVNSTIYHMKWNDYQLEVLDPSFSFPAACGVPNEPFQIVVANVGNAEINGVDFDMTWVPTDRLTMALNGTYLLNNEVSEDFEARDARCPDVPLNLDIPAGSQLPLSADLNLSFSSAYTWPLSWLGGSEATLRFQVSHTGSSLSHVDRSPPPAFYGNAAPRLKQDGYTIGDLKLGIANEAWEATLFVNNLWDERADIRRETDFFDNFWGRERTDTNTPRKFGFRLVRHF